MTDGAPVSDGAIVVEPVGRIASTLVDRSAAPMQGHEGAPDAWLVLDPRVAPAARDLAVGDRLVVVTWFDRAHRDVQRVRPRDDATAPERGVFSTRSPDRPNPVGLHPVTVRAVEDGGLRVRIGPIEAIDGTPVVDVKPLLARDEGSF